MVANGLFLQICVVKLTDAQTCIILATQKYKFGFSKPTGKLKLINTQSPNGLTFYNSM